MPKWLAAAVAVAALTLPMLPAHAGQYDGRWVIDFPASEIYATTNSGRGCAAIRIVVDIKDGTISGNLGRDPNNPTAVDNSAGPGAAPLTGTVAPDGAVSAMWQNYAVTGKLGASDGQVNVTGACGPRTGKALRVEK
jgi:hypothetical protein